MSKRTMLSIVLMALVAIGHAYGQLQATTSTTSVPDILERMSSSDLHTQKVAFDDLVEYARSHSTESPQVVGAELPGEVLPKFLSQHPEEADEIKVELIALLTEENRYFIETKNPPADAHQEDDISEHYAELIDSVASLNDERAIPALVGAMTTGGMAQNAILKYGDKALSLVLMQFKSPDNLTRVSALNMASAILSTKGDRASHDQMIALIQTSLKDPAAVVRGHAVREITCLDERSTFIPELQQIAKTDPDKLPGKADDGGDGDEFYPVRYDARRVLRDIQNNTGCNR